MLIMIVLYRWDYLFLARHRSFQRTNAKLSTELQDLKDKMYKLQNERKVEVVALKYIGFSFCSTNPQSGWDPLG